MNPKEFIQTIYLGDRGCKSITIDGWQEEVKLLVTCVSRVRGPTWNFYTAEDLEDGKLVFTGAKKLVFDPPGYIPNDYLDFVSVEEMPDGLFQFLFKINSSDDMGNSVVVNVTILAKQLHLEDSSGRSIND